MKLSLFKKNLTIKFHSFAFIFLNQLNAYQNYLKKQDDKNG